MASQQYPSQGSYPPPDSQPPPYVEDAPKEPSSAQEPPKQAAPQNVKVEKTAPKEKKGFFSSMMKDAEKLGKQITVQLDKAGDKINETVDKNYTSALLDLFKTGNVVQLISRATGRTVQIVAGSSGQLLVDANGPLDPNAFNTLWTVTNEGSNQVRIHNYNNYIAIIDGQVNVKEYLPGTEHGLETKFQLSQLQQFLMFESLKEKTRYLAFLPTGELKITSVKEPNSHFGIKLVSTAYPVITPVSQK
uniref:Uncharacterized protein n=1 Tax=Arion vulgaris TaxID=1028688 RepID=A0A0B7AJA9_9EUPU